MSKTNEERLTPKLVWLAVLHASNLVYMIIHSILVPPLAVMAACYYKWRDESTEAIFWLLVFGLCVLTEDRVMKAFEWTRGNLQDELDKAKSKE